MKRVTCRSVWGLFAAFLLLEAATVMGNDIRVTNVTWHPLGVTGQSEVTFDLSWSNSWRAAWTQEAATTAINQDLLVQSWDAAWVFVKVRPTGSTDGYAHGTLSTNPADHQIPDGTGGVVMTNSVGLTDDGSKGIGVFIHRAQGGSGPNEIAGVTLRLIHDDAGVTNGAYDVQVNAIEMVYVDQGPYALGAANGAARVAAGTVFPGWGAQEIEANAFYRADDTNKPYLVTSEAAITISSNAAVGNLWAKGGIEDCSLPAAFPKGYAAFYSMKYEVSQGQYADFLNALPSNSAAGFFIGTNYGRHTIVCSNGVYAAGRPDRGCGYMVWAYGAAYAAWAGLRPMSEMEHAKARRGPLKAVAFEFSWGTTTIWTIDGSSDVRLSLSPEDGTEIVTNSDVSVGPGLYGLGFQGKFIRGGDSTGDGDSVRGVGPLRAGIFATSNGTRVSAGAAYWGIMEMSGNLQEPAVTVANAAGRGFQGTHGSGTLTLPPDWPQADNVGGTAVDGNFCNNPPLSLATANRQPAWAANQWPLPWSLTNQISFYTSPWSIGMRCGRTAPVPLATSPVAGDASARFRGGAYDGSASAGSIVPAVVIEPYVYNQPVSAVTTNSATFNGWLASTGSSAAAVCVLWGETNSGATWAAWAHTNWFPGTEWTNNSSPSTNLTGLEPDRTYYYVFGATNMGATSIAPNPVAFITGEVTVKATDAIAKYPGNTGQFTVYRPLSATGEALTVHCQLSGSAINGVDYSTLFSNITLAAGATSAVVTVTAIPDADTTNEEAVLMLTPGAYAIGAGSNSTVTLLPFSDYDGWCLTNGYFTSQELDDPAISGPDADPDHDGMKNFDEFLAGTNPRNGQSRLGIAAVAVTPGVTNEIVVSWWSVTGKYYAVLATTNMNSGSTNVLGSSILATPSVNVYTDRVDGVGKKFYIIRLD